MTTWPWPWLLDEVRKELLKDFLKYKEDVFGWKKGEISGMYLINGSTKENEDHSSQYCRNYVLCILRHRNLLEQISDYPTGCSAEHFYVSKVEMHVSTKKDCILYIIVRLFC